ncbi:MAG: hypothetical protein R3305_10765, partial [Gammaproteobacteria bacterium]|nr:hypothetical protein [Gammaproteobacteria bacterium]
MLPEALLKRLADGREHAQSALAATLGLSAGELAAQVDALEAAGLALNRGRTTLQLVTPIAWLDGDALVAGLTPGARARLGDVTIAFELASTNRWLLDSGPPPLGRMRLAIAEYQHGGRGRRGRHWAMPPGAGLALSADWCFEAMPAALPALSLAVG